jgi:cysteinyl-tRNA synthetase
LEILLSKVYIFLHIWDIGLNVTMPLKIYNTLTRKKEVFSPVENGKVKMYVCGMTVYSDAHIGHARTYFAFDVIRRYFEFKGYDVTYVQNITDVDDKIIAAANKEGVDALEYSSRFTDICLGDLDKLGIRRADIYPKASETIPEMIKLTQKIIDNGYGYESGGDVYFSVEKFKNYGLLSGQKLEDLMSGARIDPADKKHNPFDFALWKEAKPGEPFWESPWGKGRPGWHIECSTMSSKFLGLPFDIHGGGMDLRFPHHENEIAQAEAATGKKFAKYWIHIGLLTVDGEKMSKSIGNIINIKDLLKKWDSEILRFFYAQAHYRSPPDFNEKALKDAKKGLIRIIRLKERLEDLSNNAVKEIFDEKDLTAEEKGYLKTINYFKKEFENAMDDDFNTPQAISSIFDFVNKSNKFIEKNSGVKKELYALALNTLIKIGNILTLFQSKLKKDEKSDDKFLLEKLQNVFIKYNKNIRETNIESILDMLLETREKARKNKDWKTADNIRKELDDIGFEIQDTAKGPVWRKK